MACGRSVVATRVGGPPEFVPPDAGVLVDPLDVDAIADALRVAAALPCPNPAAREAAEGTTSRSRRAGSRRCSSEPRDAEPKTRQKRCRQTEPSPMPSKIRVLIADDHRLFAEALNAILAAEPGIEVIGRARNGEEAVDQALALKPNVILMDIAMPVVDGVEATKRIRKKLRRTCILMLTGSNSRTDVARARARSRRLRDEGPDRRPADRGDPRAGHNLTAGILAPSCCRSSRSSTSSSRRRSSA